MPVDVPDNQGLAEAIRSSAGRLGIDPIDLGTAISYETGGKLSPDVWGGGGGKYLGLIQFSPENQKRYGVTPGMAPAEQMSAVEQYLKDRGVKPGHGLLDVYSAINAGRVGLYNRSDAASGGAPGTVADKVAGMAPHRVRASLLLDGKLPASVGASGGMSRVAPQQSAASTTAAPFGLAPEGEASTEDAGFAALLDAARRIAQSAHEEEPLPSALPPLQIMQGAMPLLDQRRMRRGMA